MQETSDPSQKNPRKRAIDNVVWKVGIAAEEPVE